MLLNVDWFRSDTTGEPSLGVTLLAVTCGNFTSVITGFILFLAAGAAFYLGVGR